MEKRWSYGILHPVALPTASARLGWSHLTTGWQNAGDDERMQALANGGGAEHVLLG
jgi:hypothetical protein